MRQSYPQMSSLLCAYFNQDFNFEFSDPYIAAKQMIEENVAAPDLRSLVEEMEFAIENETIIDRNFFTEAGVDTPPFDTTSENIEFFKYCIEYFHKVVRCRAK